LLPGGVKPGYPQSPARIEPNSIAIVDRELEARALGRVYPVLKDVAEILEAECLEPLATDAKRLRQAVGRGLAKVGRLP